VAESRAMRPHRGGNRGGTFPFPATVKPDWITARAWLFRELNTADSRTRTAGSKSNRFFTRRSSLLRKIGPYLDQISRDADFRREVESLLAANDEAGVFLEEPVALAAPPATMVGAVVGHYRITAEIRRGGMAVVYRAARVDDFQQEVAVKMISVGMDTIGKPYVGLVPAVDQDGKRAGGHPAAGRAGSAGDIRGMELSCARDRIARPVSG
jgi:hypothetical protein